ncbi:MAG: class I SAM-dependent methyltransferase [Patescibacteria group bacterium]|nr:class I SAM-dependent methyltransferase [Patescibacteria group bacterium]
MQNNEIGNLLKQENRYWWHVSRRIILQTFVQKIVQNNRIEKILDVGCGTGFNLQWLKKFGEVIGVDSNEEAVRLCNNRNIVAIQGNTDTLPSQIHGVSLVTAFDVLEHIENDNRALQEWGRVLRPNGRLLLTVPAYQWLFGPHDKNLSHYRRYYLPDLIKKIENNGFKVIQSSYFFFLTLPLLIISRFVDRITNKTSGYQEIPNWLNKLLIFSTSWEAKVIAKGYRLPFGSSILIYARKQI